MAFHCNNAIAFFVKLDADETLQSHVWSFRYMNFMLVLMI